MTIRLRNLGGLGGHHLGGASMNAKSFRSLCRIGANSFAIANIVRSGRSIGNEVQEIGGYRTHRERGGAWNNAVRRQDEHGPLYCPQRKALKPSDMQ